MTTHNKKLATRSSEIEVDDLLLEIFLRLPLHSIQRFITACKNWHTLIADPTFGKQWRKRNLKPSTGLILRTRVPTSVSLVPFSNDKPIPPLRRKLVFKQSCNGLLLCLDKKWYQVYNPTTDTCHILPKLGDNVIVPGSTKIHSMNLVFDPDIFGHCYKVICCVGSDTCRYWVDRIHVYSSDTGVWESVFKEFDRRVNDKGVYWNGCIHWLTQLTYFDIKNETLNKMPAPPVRYWKNNHYLGESCGRLVYARLSQGKLGDQSRVEVCEMKKDYSEWVHKHIVSLDHCYWGVLSVIHGLEEDDSFLVLKTREGIVRYNLVYGTFEDLPVSFNGGFFDIAFQYIEPQYCVC